MPCFLSSCESWKCICKSVLEGIYVIAFGICCYCCVVSKHVESICIWFYALELLCCGLIVVLGVKASLTLGREETPCGERVSWACP